MSNLKRLAAAGALCLSALVACGAAAYGRGGGQAARPAAGGASPLRLALPSQDWAVELLLAGFAQITDTINAETGERTLMAGSDDRKRRLMLVVQLRPSRGEPAADAAEWAKAGGARGVKRSEYKGMRVLRYKQQSSVVVAGADRAPLTVPVLAPMHLLAALVARDGAVVAITLAAPSVGEREEQIFYALLDGVRLVDTSAPATSFDLFFKGRPHYMTGDFKKAAEYYGRALELERRERRLDAALWRELVEEAAGALGGAGDLAGGRAVVEYGLSQEPGYARFHFLMALYHASRDDLDATLASLRTAFHNQHTLPAHLRLPDPKTYPLFQRFRDSDKFKQAVKQLKIKN